MRLMRLAQLANGAKRIRIRAWTRYRKLTNPGPVLRERKKAKTRAAIQDTPCASSARRATRDHCGANRRRR